MPMKNSCLMIWGFFLNAVTIGLMIDRSDLRQDIANMSIEHRAEMDRQRELLNSQLTEQREEIEYLQNRIFEFQDLENRIEGLERINGNNRDVYEDEEEFEPIDGDELEAEDIYTKEEEEHIRNTWKKSWT